MGFTEVEEHLRFGLPVLGLSDGGEADLLSLLPVSPVISEVEEDAQRIRQFPGVSMEAPCSSLMSGGHKAGTLGLEPGQSLGVPGEVPLDRRFAPIPVPAAMLSDK